MFFSFYFILFQILIRKFATYALLRQQSMLFKGFFFVRCVCVCHNLISDNKLKLFIQLYCNTTNTLRVVCSMQCVTENFPHRKSSPLCTIENLHMDFPFIVLYSSSGFYMRCSKRECINRQSFSSK